MSESKKQRLMASLRPRIRIILGEDIALGPGKVELLGHIEQTRSLNQAARLMGMSYMKAWLLVQVMNRSFRKPLVKSERGGVGGGGAELTPAGKRVLELYREMQRVSLEAMEKPWDAMKRLLQR